MARGNSRNKYDIVFALFSLVLGMLMGWLAYDLSGSGIIGAIVTNAGVWIFTAALLAYYSQSGLGAALNTFLYFAGVVLAYYTHFALTGGAIGVGTFIRPLIFAAIGALLGFITWHAGAKEWLGAVCAAVPISLLIAEGYPIYYSRSVSLALDIVCAIILYILLCNGKVQRLMALPFIIIFVIALVYFDAFTRIFGGWI